MRVSRISIARTVQVDLYEPERVEVTVDLDPGDCPKKAATAARQVAYQALRDAELRVRPDSANYGPRVEPRANPGPY